MFGVVEENGGEKTIRVKKFLSGFQKPSNTFERWFCGFFSLFGGKTRVCTEKHNRFKVNPRFCGIARIGLVTNSDPTVKSGAVFSQIRSWLLVLKTQVWAVQVWVGPKY